MTDRPSPLNILVLNTDLPIFPGGGGVEFLTMKHLAGLARKVGIVSMAHTRRDLERSRPLADAGVDLYLWHSPWLDGAPAPRAQRSVRRVLHRWLIRLIQAAQTRADRPADTQIMDGAFSNMAPGLIQALSDRPWHVLAVIQSSAAAMIDYVPRQLVSVLVMHDIRARLYERRAAAASTRRERRHCLAEAHRYRRFENAHCRRFDLVVTVSEEDARWVREHYRPSRVFALPLPVDTDHFVAGSPTTVCAHRIVFTGHLSHPPNVDAAVYFATDVLPRVRERVPSATFHIVGRSPVAAVTALARLPAVTLFADVPDIRTHIAEAAVIVAPLRYGSGSRQKILEAWSMQKCVVATSIGAEGLDYESGVNLVLADGTDALATAVSSALSDDGLRERLGQAGRSVACQLHDPVQLARRYYTQLEEVYAEKASRDVPMRVLLDMRWMVPGHAGGIENLARSFVQQLGEIDRHNAYTLLVPAQCRHDFDLRGRSNMRVVSLDSATAWLRRAWGGYRRALKRRIHVHAWRTPEVEDLRWLHDLGVEIAYSFPGFIHPQLYPLRQVLIVPDIQHEYLPHFFSPDALAERRRVYTGSIRRADHLCAISEFTRRTLIETLDVPPDAVTTVHLAADAMFSARPVDATDDKRTLATYGLEAGGYLYFPAHTWHHKNHRIAIEALRVLRDRYGATPLLVCSGGPREAQPAIDAQIAAAGLERQVRFLGYCPRLDAPALYRGAASLVFPSLFEGFGMPVLEAMASGCPVVCSNTTSMPEIAGDAALLVNPEDADAVAAALHQVLTDADLRRQLVARGLRQAARFSWRRHTIESLAVIRRVHLGMRTR